MHYSESGRPEEWLKANYPLLESSPGCSLLNVAPLLLFLFCVSVCVKPSWTFFFFFYQSLSLSELEKGARHEQSGMKQLSEFTDRKDSVVPALIRNDHLSLPLLSLSLSFTLPELLYQSLLFIPAPADKRSRSSDKWDKGHRPGLLSSPSQKTIGALRATLIRPL